MAKEAIRVSHQQRGEGGGGGGGGVVERSCCSDQFVNCMGTRHAQVGR